MEEDGLLLCRERSSPCDVLHPDVRRLLSCPFVHDFVYIEGTEKVLCIIEAQLLLCVLSSGVTESGADFAPVEDCCVKC